MHGSRKGSEVRQRILDVAIESFGTAGFKGATTRKIADTAGVNLPALQYYFGSKTGLYKACAEEIVAYYHHYAKKHGLDAHLIENASFDPGVARGLLKTMVSSLASIPPDREVFASFVVRELNDPGPAFNIVFKELWYPGVTMVERLISLAKGETPGSEAARVHAVLLISSFTSFRAGQQLSLQVMNWRRFGKTERAAVVAALNSQIEAIGK
jgi:TetR/AcrR family transcriptional regulator, regulator of cefoperazone and chloramphenicol sensitivity